VALQCKVIFIQLVLFELFVIILLELVVIKLFIIKLIKLLLVLKQQQFVLI
jgi:hypothetical protein